jgi:hypothetical protein
MVGQQVNGELEGIWTETAVKQLSGYLPVGTAEYHQNPQLS